MVDQEFLHDRSHFGVTLEDIARTFAREHHLDYIKLGGQSRAEGAATIVSDNKYWQDVARVMMEQGPVILLVPDTTPGLSWEIEQLATAGWLQRKVTLLFPNVPSEELDRTWNAFRALTAAHGVALPAFPRNREWHPLAARLGPDRCRWVAVLRSPWTTGPCRRAYWYAMRRCVDEPL